MSVETYQAALDTYGITAQVCQTMEECAELTSALNRVLLRGRGSLADVATEIADVEIMCAQMRLLVGDELVELEKVEKLARLQSRLAKAARHG